MSDKPQIKLAETVVLIDAAFLNFVITDIKGYFEETLHRSLQEIDLSMLTTYITLDAGITEGKNEVQFLFVYDKESSRLQYCQPSGLQEELNGVAFQSPYGEYSFASVPSEGMVAREDLFLDLLSIVSDSADVKRMIVISFNEEYGKKVTDALHEVKGKEGIQFRMNEPELPVDYKWDMLAFPVMQALGIKAEELQKLLCIYSFCNSLFVIDFLTVNHNCLVRFSFKSISELSEESKLYEGFARIVCQSTCYHQTYSGAGGVLSSSFVRPSREQNLTD